MALETTRLRLGFVPLVDAAPLVVAKERGFFAELGLDVELSKEGSWASVRDKVAVGALDGAQMPAPQMLAMSLGLSPIKISMVTGLALNLGGNSIVLESHLVERMEATGLGRTPAALKAVIEEDKAAGRPPMTFATVYPFSSHSVELQMWMESAGINMEADVRVIVVPPPQMISYLSAGNISGYCVGEPWGSLAAGMGLAKVVATSPDIFAGRLEKVFAVTSDWADSHPETHAATLEALLEAARWCDDNRCELAEILAQPQYLNVPVDAAMAPLLGEGGLPKDLLTFHRHCANFPWRSQAMWFLERMKLSGHLPQSLDSRAAAIASFRPDLYRVAALALGLDVPLVDYKTEGEHAEPWTLLRASRPIQMGADRMLDGKTFDPSALTTLAQGPIAEQGDL
jgi:nitrate/nitrite transport system substrate-binding protein